MEGRAMIGQPINEKANNLFITRSQLRDILSGSVVPYLNYNENDVRYILLKEHGGESVMRGSPIGTAFYISTQLADFLNDSFSDRVGFEVFYQMWTERKYKKVTGVITVVDV